MIKMASYEIMYGRKCLSVNFPDKWHVETVKINREELSKESINRAIINPTDSLRIKDIAQKKDSVAIVIEDYTRCMLPSNELMNAILEELKMAGVRKDNIFFIGATGVHRKMSLADFEKKLGTEISRDFRVVTHDVFDEDNLMFFGNTSFGTPVYINSEVANSDFIIGIGAIVPHGAVGLSGGAKLISPGVAGYITIQYNHTKIDQEVEINSSSAIRKMRLDMEEASSMVGMKFIVAGLIDSDLKLVDLVAGDPIQAHRRGMEKALKLYQVKISKEADIVIACSYPFDIDFFQSVKGLITSVPFVKEGGVIVWISSCSEGLGCHYLTTLDESYKISLKSAIQAICNKASVIFSSNNLNFEEIEEYLPADVIFEKDIEKAIEKAIHLKPEGGDATILKSSPLVIGHL